MIELLDSVAGGQRAPAESSPLVPVKLTHAAPSLNDSRSGLDTLLILLRRGTARTDSSSEFTGLVDGHRTTGGPVMAL